MLSSHLTVYILCANGTRLSLTNDWKLSLRSTSECSAVLYVTKTTEQIGQKKIDSCQNLQQVNIPVK